MRGVLQLARRVHRRHLTVAPPRLLDHTTADHEAPRHEQNPQATTLSLQLAVNTAHKPRPPLFQQAKTNRHGSLRTTHHMANVTDSDRKSVLAQGPGSGSGGGSLSGASLLLLLSMMRKMEGMARHRTRRSPQTTQAGETREMVRVESSRPMSSEPSTTSAITACELCFSALRS